MTWRWRVRVGSTAGSARLWFPESLLAPWLGDDPPIPTVAPIPLAPFADLTSDWRAEVGLTRLPNGLARLRPGALLLIEGAPLRGTLRSPEGRVELVQSTTNARSAMLARTVPDTAAARLILESSIRRVPTPRETPAMPPPTEINTPGTASADIPVTLTVELGRINLPLGRLAALHPGDILELGRHAREPVELTSGGRLIARGELVQVDTELGVRVTQVFL